jgi:hypothetical protein
LAYTISGTSTYYAGGGGGGVYANTPGTGGSGVGGAGGANSQNGFDGATNRGGGGGGSGYINAGTATTSGGNGGSGIVIVRYLSPAIPTPYLVATGGSTSRDGDYLVHTFTGSNSFNVISLSSTPAYNSLEYLVVAGGGGSSFTDQTTGVGGGGAGGFLTGFSTASLGAYSIIVGAGGAKGVAPTVSTQGSNSSFGVLQSTGGGAGSNSLKQNANGGSGGGVGRDGGSGKLGGTGIVGQGFDGGSNISNTNASGGGGAAQAGFDSGTGAGAGSGGNGKLFYGTYYAGGGGGGAWFLGGAGTGGLGGGANGGTVGQGVDAVANTGGGAGGGVGFSAAYGLSGGNGGSGIVIVRYFSPQTEYIVASGGNVTRDGDYLVHTFTGSDTLNITNAPSNAVLQYLVVAGGGAGGNDVGGGGSGGQSKYGGLIPETSAYPIIIGAGGTPSNTSTDPGGLGGNTTFNQLTSIGGGGGGTFNLGSPTQGAYGGGAIGYTIINGGAVGLIANKGGDNLTSAGASATGGGGGGAGGNGADSIAAAGGFTAGGVGSANSISGTSVTYSAGGKGAGDAYTGSQAGAANTGNGGDAAGSPNIGKAGGSGIVIVRYLSPIVVGPYTTAFNNSVIANGGSLTSIELDYLTVFENSLGTDLAQFDRLWIFGLSDKVAATISFVNPNSTRIDNDYDPSWIPYEGWNGNGGDYMRANFNPAIEGVNYTLNNASIGIYSRTNLDGSQIEIGAQQDSGDHSFLSIRDTDTFYSGVNSDSDILTTNLDSRGLFVSNRFNSTSVNVLKNGVVLQTGTNDSTVVPDLDIFLLAANFNGSAGQWSTRQISLAFLGSSNYNQTNFYNAVQALGTSLGWAV